MRRSFQRLVSILLCAALVWTTGEGAQAALCLHEPLTATSSRLWPHVVRPVSDPAYFTEEALVERLVSPTHVSPRISLGHLYRRFVLPLKKKETWFSAKSTFVLTSLSAFVLSAWQFWGDPYSLSLALAPRIFMLHVVDTLIRRFFGANYDFSGLRCGNLLACGKVPLDQVAGLLEQPLRDLLARGIYSFGFYVMIPVWRKVPEDAQLPGFPAEKKVLVWEYRVEKVLLDKREDPFQTARASIRSKIAQVMKEAAYPTEINIVSFHSRLGSVGSDGETEEELEQAAQPGLAPPNKDKEDWQLRWEPVKESNSLQPRYVNAREAYQLNGDISGLKGPHALSPAEVAGNQAARVRFSRWLGYSHVPPGDAPKEALEQKMYHTERLWYASLRYALFTYLVRPGDALDRTPPFAEMKQWEISIQKLFQQWVRKRTDVAAPWFMEPKTDAEAQAIEQTKMQQADEFKKFLMSNSNSAFMRDIRRTLSDPAQQDILLTNATQAFWRNSLEYAALREMKPRVVGTQAADYTSSLNPPESRVMRVNTSNGQGLVEAFSEDGKMVSTASDRLVLYGLNPKSSSHMFRLDSAGNESAIFGWGADGRIHMTVYHGTSNVPIPEETLRKLRFRRLHDRRDFEYVPPDPATNHRGVMELGIRRAAMQVHRLRESWDRVRRGFPSRNLSAVTERSRVIVQGRIYSVILRYLLANGLSPQDMDQAAWNLADEFSRQIWSYEKTPTQVLNEIDVLTRDAARRPDAVRIDPAQINFDSLNLRYDAVYIGTGKTELALRKSALSLQRSLGLKILVMSGNDFLILADKHRENVDGLLHELGVSRHTIFRIASDSGAETYEKNIAAAYLRVLTEEPFGVAGSKDNHLVDLFGAGRVETTENPGSKEQDGLVAYLAMVQNLQEGDLFLTENITARFDTGGPDWEKAPFFKTPFTHDQVTQLLMPSNDVMVNATDRLMGYTADGISLDIQPGSSDSANLREEGKRIAERHLEPARFWLLTKIYVLTTVIGLSFHFGPFQFGPPVTALLPHIVHQPGWTLLLLAHSADALIYCSFALGLLLIKRWIFLKMKWSDTRIFEGFGLPSFTFVSPFSYVHEALRDYSRIGEALGYSTTKSHRYASDVKRVIDDFKAVPTRNSLVEIFRPGSSHPAYESNDLSADQAGRHLMTQLNLPFPGWMRWFTRLLKLKPVSPKVMMVGTHEPVSPRDKWGRMARVKDITVKPPAFAVPPGTAYRQLPYHVAEYYLEQYVSFTWLLMGFRMLATELDIVSKGVLGFLGALGFFRYKAGRFFGGFAVKSTQDSAPGSRVLESVAAIMNRLPMRMVAIIRRDDKRIIDTQQNPVVIDPTAEWQFWPSPPWLHTEAREPVSITQPTRSHTFQPKTLSATAPSVVEPVQETPVPSHATEPAKEPGAFVASAEAISANGHHLNDDLLLKASQQKAFTPEEQGRVIILLGEMLEKSPAAYSLFQRLTAKELALPEEPPADLDIPMGLWNFLFQLKNGTPRPFVTLVLEANGSSDDFEKAMSEMFGQASPPKSWLDRIKSRVSRVGFNAMLPLGVGFSLPNPVKWASILLLGSGAILAITWGKSKKIVSLNPDEFNEVAERVRVLRGRSRISPVEEINEQDTLSNDVIYSIPSSKNKKSAWQDMKREWRIMPTSIKIIFPVSVLIFLFFLSKMVYVHWLHPYFHLLSSHLQSFHIPSFHLPPFDFHFLRWPSIPHLHFPTFHFPNIHLPAVPPAVSGYFSKLIYPLLGIAGAGAVIFIAAASALRWLKSPIQVWLKRSGAVYREESSREVFSLPTRFPHIIENYSQPAVSQPIPEPTAKPNAETTIPQPLAGTLRFNQIGDISEVDSRLPDLLPETLQWVFNTLKEGRLGKKKLGINLTSEPHEYLLQVGNINQYTGFAQLTPPTEPGGTRGLIAIDSKLVRDAESGVSGARWVLEQELTEQLLRLDYLLGKEAGIQVRGVSSDPASEEFFIQQMKLRIYLKYVNPARQNSIIDYWMQDGNDAGFAENIYAPALQVYKQSLKEGIRKEQAETQALKAVKKGLTAFCQAVAKAPAPEFILPAPPKIEKAAEIKPAEPAIKIDDTSPVSSAPKFYRIPAAPVFDSEPATPEPDGFSFPPRAIITWSAVLLSAIIIGAFALGYLHLPSFQQVSPYVEIIFSYLHPVVAPHLPAALAAPAPPPAAFTKFIVEVSGNAANTALQHTIIVGEDGMNSVGLIASRLLNQGILHGSLYYGPHSAISQVWDVIQNQNPGHRMWDINHIYHHDTLDLTSLYPPPAPAAPAVPIEAAQTVVNRLASGAPQVASHMGKNIWDVLASWVPRAIGIGAVSLVLLWASVRIWPAVSRRQPLLRGALVGILSVLIGVGLWVHFFPTHPPSASVSAPASAPAPVVAQLEAPEPLVNTQTPEPAPESVQNTKRPMRRASLRKNSVSVKSRSVKITPISAPHVKEKTNAEEITPPEIDLIGGAPVPIDVGSHSAALTDSQITQLVIHGQKLAGLDKVWKAAIQVRVEMKEGDTKSQLIARYRLELFVTQLNQKGRASLLVALAGDGTPAPENFPGFVTTFAKKASGLIHMLGDAGPAEKLSPGMAEIVEQAKLADPSIQKDLWDVTPPEFQAALKAAFSEPAASTAPAASSDAAFHSPWIFGAFLFTHMAHATAFEPWLVSFMFGTLGLLFFVRLTRPRLAPSNIFGRNRPLLLRSA